MMGTFSYFRGRYSDTDTQDSGNSGVIENYDENEEQISVYNAAVIWDASGREDDYRFGYTVKELEEAL